MTDQDLPRRNFLQATGWAAGATLLGGSATAAAPSPGTHPPAGFSSRLPIQLTLNGRALAAEVAPRTSLLDWLREQAQLSGTKKGCNEGACGACTVLLDGRRVNACLTLAASCDGMAVTTVEGLAAPDGSLHAVQAAFIAHDAFQCGYCTPGQVVSAVACIREGHATDAATVREWMSGNICRCAAYPQITAAVLDAGARKEASA